MAVLTRNLLTMSEWVYVDRATLEAARRERGLSYETMARQIPVSSKSWERYEKAGRIPRGMIERVAEILELEIELPAPTHRRVEVREPVSPEEILREVRELRAVADRMAEFVDTYQAERRRGAPAQRPAPGRSRGTKAAAPRRRQAA